jgi:hypothetical protein
VLSTAFAQWELDGHGDYKDLLTKRAFEMVVSRDPLLTATGIPSTPDFIQPLLGRKLLIQRDNDFYFRHNLIRDYLASLWLQDQWRDILSDQSISIDQNWTEMLKFGFSDLDGPDRTELTFAVLKKSRTTAGRLFTWLEKDYPESTKQWSTEFKSEYADVVLQS